MPDFQPSTADIRNLSSEQFEQFMKGAERENRPFYQALRSPELNVAEAKAIQSVLDLPPSPQEKAGQADNQSIAVVRALRERAATGPKLGQ